MANKVEILIEVDPHGRGQAVIKSLGTGLDTLGKKSVQAGSAGREALDGFAGGLGVPTNIAGASAAVGAGVLLIGNSAKNAYLEAASATRVLKADTKEAGLEFAATRAEARAFGEDLGVSNKEAEVSFSQFIRVVKAAGLTENLSKYRKDFADLAAAYGLQASEIETLTSQLLSGQDEALNRLGISDPSQLYRKYAEGVNKTVEQLTEEEKVRARLLAVIEKADRFEGEAEKRRGEAIGQWAQLSANIANATSNLGEFLAKSTVGRNVPNVINAFLQNPTAFALGPVGAGEIYNSVEAQQQLEADRLQAARNAERLQAANKIKADQDAFLAKFSGTDDPTKQAKFKDDFISRYENLFKDPRLDAVSAMFAERQFNQLKGILDPEKAKEFSDKFAKFWENYAKTALNALKTARDAAEANLGRLAEIAGGDNPYVRILVDAEERAKELARTFGILGDKAVAEMQRTEEAYTQQKLAALDLDQALKAAALRREAAELEGYSGLSAAETRRLSVIDREIAAAKSVPELLAKSEAILKGLVGLQKGQFDAEGKRINPNEALRYELGVDFAQVNKGIFEELQRINTGGFSLQGGRQAQNAVNQALVDFFNNLAPDFQARIAQGLEGPTQQRVFAEAFEGVAQAMRDSVQEEIAKAAVADRAIEAVRSDIALIEDARRRGLDSREADRRLLATTGELGPGETPADIRQARIEALRREADKEATARQEGEKTVKESTEATKKLTESIDKMAEEARKPENRKILIEFVDRARGDIRKELYGSLAES